MMILSFTSKLMIKSFQKRITIKLSWQLRSILLASW